MAGLLKTKADQKKDTGEREREREREERGGGLRTHRWISEGGGVAYRVFFTGSYLAQDTTHDLARSRLLVR